MANLSGLNPIFAARLSAVIAAAEKATGQKAEFSSGIRSRSEQAGLYRRYVESGFKRQYIAAPPGRSAHERKEAVDIKNKVIRDWVQLHATEYGLEAGTARGRARQAQGKNWTDDGPHIQLARGTLKTPYDSTPNAFAAGARGLPPAQQAAADVAAGQTPSVPGGPPTLRKGATDAKTGGAVTRLQQQLAAAGFGVGPKGIDGVYGTDTAAAVRAAEKQYGLDRDRGVAGPQVQAALAGNERLRTVADTQARFGGPLAPGGFPSIPGSPPPMGIGRDSPAVSPVPIAQNPALTMPRPQGPLVTAPPDPNAPPLVPPEQAVVTPHSLQTGVTRGAPRPAPPVAPGGPPAPGYDTRGVSAGLSSPNVGAANALMQQVAARQAADLSQGGNSPLASPDVAAYNLDTTNVAPTFPGRPGYPGSNSPRASNLPRIDVGGVGAMVNAGLGASDYLQSLFGGGPPTATATPLSAVPQGFAPIPPTVPESASPAPSEYNRWGRQISGGPADSLDALLERQNAAIRGMVTPKDPVADAAFRAIKDNPANRAAEQADLWQGILAFDRSGTYDREAMLGRRQSPNIEDRRGDPVSTGPSWADAGARPWGSQAPVPESASPYGGYNRWGRQISGGPAFAPTSLGGDLSRLGTPGERAEDVPGEAVGLAGPGIPQQGSLAGYGSTDVLRGGGALEDYLQAPQVGPPAPATVVPSAGDHYDPLSSAYVPIAPAGDQTIAPAGAVFGDTPQGVAGGFGANDAAAEAAPGAPPLGVPSAQQAAKGALMGSMVHPRTLTQKLASGAISAAGNAFVPGLGILLGAITRSIQRGGLDNAQQYTGGPVTSYDRAAPNPYGGYTTGSSYSVSPFTPSGAGWHAPSFSQGSGGSLNAWQPNPNDPGHGTYIDSRGNEHPF